ncbi:hypothetical protein J2N86_13760 [Legionella lytica]|uniref:Uncharacterized protein n=1 Tax=Legionella lytica TaxID=96232 RepID=A0ABY4Y7Y2_9GAMM|nr:hypothetical protein [Legionella lytica]USQ13721.1 hypothetical protein J2N86_13760 [Legionella lytica]
MDFIPIVGQLKAAEQMWSGKDFLTGTPMSTASPAVGLLPGGKSISTAFKWLGKAGSIGIKTISNNAERSLAASHIKEARKLLQEAGLPREARNEIINSFEHATFRIVKTQGSRIGYRTFDDSSATLVGRYLSETVLPNQTERITKLALPNNSATKLGEVYIPKNSLIFEGKIAPQLRFSSGMVGGEKQLFLTGNINQYGFKEISMPRAIFNTRF